MSALAQALAYRRVLEESAALRLLRADHVAIVAALLGEHLGEPGARRSTEDIHELIDTDLEILREHFEIGARTAKAYCDDWRNGGFLIRRPATDARGETYELSAAGFDAIRILHQLDAPRSTVTESRLINMTSALRQLAIDTDPDSNRRLEALQQQRERIDEEIARISSGDSPVLDPARATERVQDVLFQAQELPADFARVRARFEQLNHDLRASILTSEGTHGTVLDEIFRGVDLIESSEEGLTFSAFSSLIRDAERSAAFEDDVAAILAREFATELTPSVRATLRHLMRTMKHGSHEVHTVLTEFARGLRRYVFSQEFQRDRVLRTALQEALAAALEAAPHIRPYSPLGDPMELSAMRMFSVGELSLHDPSEFDSGQPLGTADLEEVDFAQIAQIARASEIDFAELIQNVDAMLERAAGAPVTVGELLAEFPATQGVASVIGLISLATQHGQVHAEHTETLHWKGLDEVPRAASTTLHTFTERLGA
ncbi:MAG: DUF3375 domain-containing protein, partial [bacterium]|nr:DUF3375 domain-containing protein [bacterium]